MLLAGHDIEKKIDRAADKNRGHNFGIM